MRQYSHAVAWCGGLALAVGLLAVTTDAQEPRPRAKTVTPAPGSEPGRVAPPARPGEPARVAHPAWVHVPDYFGQIEPPLTSGQREQIYEIQARALRESEAVLNAAQRTSLEQHRGKGARPSRDAG